jgi:hypothetical protein
MWFYLIIAAISFLFSEYVTGLIIDAIFKSAEEILPNDPLLILMHYLILAAIGVGTFIGLSKLFSRHSE